MIQIFACKQVFGISGVYYYLRKHQEPDISSPLCPFCTLHHEMTGYVLACPKEGRVNMLLKLSEICLNWLIEEGTPRDLIFLLVRYIHG